MECRRGSFAGLNWWGAFEGARLGYVEYVYQKFIKPFYKNSRKVKSFKRCERGKKHYGQQAGRCVRELSMIEVQHTCGYLKGAVTHFGSCFSPKKSWNSAAYTGLLYLYPTELSLQCRLGAIAPFGLLSILTFAPLATFKPLTFIDFCKGLIKYPT